MLLRHACLPIPPHPRGLMKLLYNNRLGMYIIDFTAKIVNDSSNYNIKGALMTEIQTSQEQTSKFLSGFQLFSPSIEALGKNFWTFCQLVLLVIGGGIGCLVLL